MEKCKVSKYKYNKTYKSLQFSALHFHALFSGKCFFINSEAVLVYKASRFYF